ncbi:amidohydrolase family protein [Methylocella sp. CPCC 101449]|uniref:amidohydrolase family protein n=1 Tax=Methylocella sp. CPCC 101449 TaxID=2987531 RepID=UPI00288E909C|nr:amidohydrolase family protein [Methylocella sp. CPCC 101449]MDT2022398.1 amidohydrolase family protein [Methylocella sp. CPCC 101449]
MRSEFMPFKFPARSPGPLAIAHVTVIPMDANRRLEDHTVLIENGRIVAIAPSSAMDLSARPEVSVVDGAGRYLMPGLADMYTHYREPAEAPLYLAHGITTARTSGNPFQLAMEWSAERAEFPSPRVITVTPGFDGIGPTGRTDMPHGVPLTRPEDAAALVKKYADRGYHQIMPFSLLTPECLAAVGRAAAERGLRVVGNCPNAVSWEEAVAAGMSGFQQLHLIARDHMGDQFAGQTYWDRFDPAPGTKLDFEKIRRLGGFLAKHQAWNLPTVAFHQRASQPVEVSLAHPSLRYVPRSTINDWETTIVRWGHRGRVNAEEWRRLARERAIAFHKVIGIFHEEGAPQLTCTDGVNPYNVQGDTLHQEIENFASAGLSAYEALRCSTSEAARFMNEESEWGTIGVGKRADLILINADPLQDVRATRNIEAVFVNGYHLKKSNLDDLLRQRAELVQGAPPVAGTDLPAASGNGDVTDEGVWRERICGAEFGRVTYRHTRLPEGGWRIEERHAGAEPRRHAMRRSSQIVVDADLNLRTADYELETFAGVEQAHVEHVGDGYALTFKAVDGHESQSHLQGAPRPPSEHMALSVVPLLAGRHGAGTIAALDAETSLGAAELVLSVSPEPGAPGETHWQLETSRLGQRATQLYALGADGRLARMTETTILLWPRELQPVDAPVRATEPAGTGNA